MALPSRVTRQEGPAAFLFASQARKRPALASTHGFTLVEMAVILVIAGILVALGAAMLTPLTTMTKTREARDTMNASKEAIISWAATNNRIPPAATFPNVATSTADPWGQQIVYLFDSNLSPATATKDTICGRGSTSLSVTTISPAATINNVAFVMISTGGDGRIQTRLNGAAITAGTRAVAAGTVRADNNSSDIITWVTLEELRSRIGCPGAPLKIITNELPTGVAATTYPAASASVAITTDGGATPGTLRWCVEAPSLTPLPSGISFTPSLAGAVRVAPNTCNGPANALAEASWIASPTLTISGMPVSGAQGSYNFTIYVRDNNDTGGANDNIASKAYVLTIHPQ